MNIIQRFTNWLENSASTPAFGGWVLLGITICFFGAAINTMAGWLYVISGVSFALLFVSFILPPRSLAGLVISRRPISPVSAGDELTIELEIHNRTQRSITLLEVQDILPIIFGGVVKKPIEAINNQETFRWVYSHSTSRRGVYRWQTVELRSGAPWGLFSSRRPHNCPAKAIVYPTVLPLSICPLVDEMGQEDSQRGDPRGRPWQAASNGLVRSLVPTV